MFPHLKEIGKPSSPEDRVKIPPHICRLDPLTPWQPQIVCGNVRNTPVECLPEGSLNWLPFRRGTERDEFSDQEIGRVARVLTKASPDEDVSRVIRTLVAESGSGGMYPPPDSPPTDPGGDADDGEGGRRDGEGTVFPIADDEFGILRPPLDQLIQQLAYRGKEEAGLLFAPEGSQVATHFFRDKIGKKTASSFTLDVASLNAVICSLKPYNLHLQAVVHGHPNGVFQLSPADIRYLRDLFAHPKNDAAQFFMPLVVNGQLIPYLLYRDEPDRVVRAGLKIIG